MKKILITGGAGFIGFHLSKILVDQGHFVSVLDNFSRGQNDLAFNKLIDKNNFCYIKKDITEPSAFNDLGEFDWIFHLAAINGTQNFYKKPIDVLKVGILGTFNILDWFKKTNKGKLLFTSSSEVYSGAYELLGNNFPIPTPEKIPLVITDPENLRWSYAGSKLTGELLIQAYGKTLGLKDRLATVRYHNIYGPRMGYEHVVPQFINRAMARENPFKIYGADATRCFCYVSDAIDATIKVINSDSLMGSVTHIGRDDDEIKIKKLSEIINRMMGNQCQYEIHEAPPGSVKRRCPNIEKLREVNYSPKTNLEEGLEKTIEWYMENGTKRSNKRRNKKTG